MRIIFGFLFFLIIVITQFILLNPELRCTKFGKMYTDNILGFDYRCPYVIKPHLKNENIFDLVGHKEFKSDKRYSLIKHKNKVECKKNSKVILFIGQSLAANSNLSNVYDLSKHSNFFEGNCYQLSNPVLGTTGNLSSILPAIASKLKIEENIIFLNNSWGGTSVIDWSIQNNLTNYVKQNLKALKENNNNLKIVVWIQGETDAFTDVNYIKYFNEMEKLLFEDFKDNDYKIIITQNSICSSNRDNNLNKIQKKISNKNHIFITDSADSLDMNYRYDGCHLNKFGTEIFADEIAKLINQIY